MRGKYRILTTLLLIAAFYTPAVHSQQADAGRDTTILKGTTVTIGPEEYDETWCFSWKSKDISTINDRKAPQPGVKPDTTSIYHLTVVGPDFEFTSKDDVEVKVKNTKVGFKEYKSQRYGFDGYDENQQQPWKSVKSGDYDFIVSTTQPAEDTIHVRYKSNHPLFPVRPDRASNDTQLIVIEPVIKGETEVQANFNATDGENINKFKLATYNELIYSVALIPVVEENDDFQYIEPDNGAPYETAILPGANNTLESVNGGDDVIDGNTINTGPNGKRESIRAGDDDTLIAMGNGKAFTTCIGIGVNHFWDTKKALGDDTFDGDNLTTGPNGICNTNANDTNSTLNTFDLSLFQGYLNKVYSQAVITWYVYILPPRVANYDLDRNDSLLYPIGGTTWNAEMQKIINACGDVILFDKNIFLVNNGETIDGSGDYSPLLGFMKFNQPYGFIFIDRGLETVGNTIAHEIGHGLGLHHTYETDTDPEPPASVRDENNLMHPTTNTGWLLRKEQWDQLNP